MRWKTAGKLLTGAGIGVFITFLASLRLIPETTPVEEVLAFYLLGLAIGAAAFGVLGGEFRASPVAYLGGMLAIVAVTLISEVSEVTAAKLFAVILISMLALEIYRPMGVTDALLAGPVYFGGVATALAVEGALGLLKSVETMVGTVFVGIIGTIAAFLTAVLSLMIPTKPEKPKP
ncbi:hypothetical protein [Thermococcus waiotapuensis]|uniref:Uncharacterized protein n=1 Tax=Thermococcus waiotapuensis TaxID=90909 RepID=A0AAE4NX33_9EURY|nr:hypothetical protein [Thermococcus waiotapuensis]MDV3104433.1 hypothetical protein [Thermococcus waiotapuensis]